MLKDRQIASDPSGGLGTLIERNIGMIAIVRSVQETTKERAAVAVKMSSIKIQKVSRYLRSNFDVMVAKFIQILSAEVRVQMVNSIFITICLLIFNDINKKSLVIITRPSLKK
jgi:hypothetical protein